jgi:hypothetical protein
MDAKHKREEADRIEEENRMLKEQKTNAKRNITSLEFERQEWNMIV